MLENTMEVVSYKEVIIRSTYVVDFLTRHKENTIVQRTCESMFEGICRSLSEFMSYDSDIKRESVEDTVSKLLREYTETIQSVLSNNNEENRKQVAQTMQDIMQHMSKTLDDQSLLHERILMSQQNTHISKDEMQHMLGECKQHQVLCQKECELHMYDMIDKLKSDMKAVVMHGQSSIQTVIHSSMKAWFDTISKESSRDGDLLASKLYEHMSNKLYEIKEEVTNVMKPFYESEVRIREDICKLPSKLSCDESVITYMTKAETELRNQREEIQRRMLCLEQQIAEKVCMSLSSYNEIPKYLERHIPTLTRSIVQDCLKNVEHQTSLLDHMLRSTSHDISTMRDSLTSMKAKYESMESSLSNIHMKSSTKSKGTEGELRVFDMLSERLLSRDGYIVEHVAGKSHACDIIIKHTSHPDVRIECKSHGEHTGMKIKACEVSKFKRDLQYTNDHGIFLSFHSGIV